MQLYLTTPVLGCEPTAGIERSARTAPKTPPAVLGLAGLSGGGTLPAQHVVAANVTVSGCRLGRPRWDGGGRTRPQGPPLLVGYQVFFLFSNKLFESPDYKQVGIETGHNSCILFKPHLSGTEKVNRE